MPIVLTNEVGYGFQSLLLSHDKADLLLLAVSHQLSVANSALFPLLVSPSEKLGSDLHQALQILFSRRSCYGR